jgi:hypothetical protein
MIRKRFVCDTCEESFVIEILEAGEAEHKNFVTH